MNFIEELMYKLKEQRGLADTTIRQYIRNLLTLNGKKPFDNLGFLKKKKDIDAKLLPYSPNTRKSFVTTIVSVLTLEKEKDKRYNPAYNHFYSQMMKINHSIPKTNQKTDKENENWIHWKDVLEIKNKLESISNPQWEDILKATVLALYTEIQPRRNQDYYLMDVVQKITNDLPNDRNYYSVKDGVFVFNRYKTQKKYGQQIIEVPHTLLNILNTYISKHPLRNQRVFPLLVYSDGTPFTKVNSITRILNSIFGKKIGASMLRHIYLSDKYDVEEMKQDAEVMAHSTGQQRDYLRVDTNPSA